MNAPARTLEQVRQAGLDALVRELGTVDTIRFLQQFETGTGDYTQERQTLLADADVQTLAAQIKALPPK